MGQAAALEEGIELEVLIDVGSQTLRYRAAGPSGWPPWPAHRATDAAPSLAR